MIPGPAGERDLARVRDAAAVLAAGGLVAYPTETVYGLGADARRPEALAALEAAKGREAGRGISVLVTGLAMARPLLAAEPPGDARELARRFWPGPLTIVLPAADGVAEALRGPQGGIGLRCSSDPWAAALVEALGGPVTATSANRSGEPPARSAAEARAAFAGKAGATVHVLDGGSRTATDVSTVVEFSAGRATLRRRGAIAATELSQVLQLSEESRG